MYLYHKGDLKSMRKDASDLAKDRYFNGCSENRLVQENFDLITIFIQESADKHIARSQGSRSLDPHRYKPHNGGMCSMRAKGTVCCYVSLLAPKNLNEPPVRTGRVQAERYQFK